MALQKITEIIPDDMPQWDWDAFNEGQFFRTCIDKVENNPDTERLLKLADSCSDLIYGGERGWENLDFNDFVQHVRDRIRNKL